MGCGCQDSQLSDRDRRKAFAERAMKLAMSLPDDVTCQKNFREPEARFLSALRDLAAGYSLAHTWSESETRSRLEALKFADAAMDYAFDMAAIARDNSGGGGGRLSCTAKCNQEKTNCTKDCDRDADAGYWCYFDCRLTYMACLSQCVLRGGIGGGGGIVIA